MRYGLSLLVCFALAVSASAQECANGKCKVAFDKIVTQPVKTVVTAPVAVVRGVSCQVSAAPVQRTGPIRQFFRRCR